MFIILLKINMINTFLSSIVLLLLLVPRRAIWCRHTRLTTYHHTHHTHQFNSTFFERYKVYPKYINHLKLNQSKFFYTHVDLEIEKEKCYEYLYCRTL